MLLLINYLIRNPVFPNGLGIIMCRIAESFMIIFHVVAKYHQNFLCVYIDLVYLVLCFGNLYYFFKNVSYEI